MRTISKQIVRCTDEALGWSSRIAGLTRILGGILLLARLLHPVEALSQNLLGSYAVNLAWGASPSSEVTGYRVYYGPASGNYANSVAVGNVTTNTVAGLASGVTYFFAVVAYDASGMESTPSNEINFTPGPKVRTRVLANGQVVVSMDGLSGQNYDIEATQDFSAWTVIGTVTLGGSGALDFTDTNAVSFPKRFYRTRQKP